MAPGPGRVKSHSTATHRLRHTARVARSAARSARVAARGTYNGKVSGTDWHLQCEGKRTRIAARGTTGSAGIACIQRKYHPWSAIGPPGAPG